MNYDIVTLEEKTIVGLETRTGINDPKCQEKIGGLWNSFMGNGMAGTIKNIKSGHAFGIYSNYTETDYDVTVGMDVSKTENPELKTKIIPAGKYAKFSICGHVVNDVAKAWEDIWTMNLDRTFTADFEEYLDCEMENAHVDIYVALK